MKVSEFHQLLLGSPAHELCFVLPDGSRVPAHFHITEVGRTDRRFLDCGGTLRHLAACTLQAWVADDVDHRLTPGALASILSKAAPILETEELEVEIEYENRFLSQFPILGGRTEGDMLVFQLGTKHTDCLAKEICVPAQEDTGCCSSGGCC